MVDFSGSLERLKRIGDTKGGAKALSAEAGVPASTVYSFKKRGWSHKNLDVLAKLMEAAERIEQRG